jgi:hypothetical protein
MRRLDMGEWIENASFAIVRDLKDSEGNAVYGLSSWQPEERKCWIAIARDCDGDVFHETVIHELLHLRLEGHRPPPSPEDYDESYELALNRIARALWEAWSE